MGGEGKGGNDEMTVFQHISLGAYIRVFFNQRFVDGKYVGLFYDSVLLVTLRGRSEIFISLDKISGIKLLKVTNEKKTAVKRRQSPPQRK